MKKNLSDARGLTLIDIAIGMVVLALIMTPLIQVYDEYIRNKNKSHNEATIGQTIKSAITQYYYDNNGRYPCPADPTLQEDNPAYGTEIVDCVSNPLGGINGITAVGMVPFITLNIPESAAYDAWGNHITYIVSAERAETPINVSATNTVLIRTRQPQTCNGSIQTFNAIYALITHGPKGVGAYNRSGQITSQCLTGGNTTAETENCDHTANALYQDEICTASDNQNSNYFDDYLDYTIDPPTGSWIYSSAPGSIDDIIAASMDVGINVDDPANIDEDLVVGGVMFIENDLINNPQKQGTLEVEVFCDENGQNCTSPLLIAGDEDAVDCASGIRNNIVGDGRSSAISGFSLNMAQCNGIVRLKTISGTEEILPESPPCATGAIGIEPGTGNLICN